MTDRAELHQTFDDWGRDVRRKVADLKAQGIALKPVIFDAEGLVAFCLAKNIHAEAKLGRSSLPRTGYDGDAIWRCRR